MAGAGTHKVGTQWSKDHHMALRDEERCSPTLLDMGRPLHSCSLCGPAAQMGCTPLNRLMQGLGYQNPTVALEVQSLLLRRGLKVPPSAVLPGMAGSDCHLMVEGC